jgi:hypothetical protein
MADSISIYSLDTPQTESPPLPDLPERSKRRRIQVQPIPNAPFPTPEPEEKPSCRQWLLHAISDYTSPVTIAAKRFYKALLNPRAPNPDIELGEPSSTIPAHDGTVADPEPRRNLPTDPKTKSEIPSQRFKERFWFTDDPGFKAFIREAWPDLITMAVCFGVAAAIYAWAKPLTPEYFLLSQSQYAHPKLDEYITTTVSAVISFGVPFIFIGLCGIFLIGSFWDTNSAVSTPSFPLIIYVLPL